MAATLPGFQSAAKLDPSPSREDELEDLVRRQAEQLERLQNGWIEPPSAPKSPPVTMKPDEKRALIQLLNDLAEKNKGLEEQTRKQSREIADLKKANEDMQKQVYDVKDLAKYCLQSLSKRLSILEDGPNAADAPSVKSHLDNLYAHMKAVGRKQVRFSEAAKILGVSRQRVHQFRAEIAQDDRFIVLKSENHKKRMLIRLREYYQKT